jgi:HEAT repeat protein
MKMKPEGKPESAMTLRIKWVLFALAGLAWSASGADQEAAVNDLIPRLADANVEARYAAQMQLQELASASSRPEQAAEREAFGKVLAAKAADASVPQPARVWIVRQLEYMGGAEAVESLARLLGGPDAELRECARRALEKNPASAAGLALRAALEKGGEAVWRVGLINSLGQRGEAGAEALLLAQAREEQTAAVAWLALGRIATPTAIDALKSLLEEKRQPGVAVALVEAAQRLQLRGDAINALEIYRQVYRCPPAATFTAARAAALGGWVKLDPAGASERILQAISGSEPKLRQAALTAAAGHPITLQLLVATLPRLDSLAKIQVMSVLDSPLAEQQIIPIVSDPDEAVRRSALEALGRCGSDGSVPVLLAAATDESKPGKSTAETALARLSGSAAVASLEKAAATGETKSRVVAINALAARRHVAALPAMMNYTADPEAAVRKAAYAALRNMASDGEIEPLARQVLAGKSDAAAALSAAARRAQDKPAAVRHLVGLAGNDQEKQGLWIEPLSELGGEQALEVLAKLAAGGNAATQAEAVRALGNWTDLTAAKPLLAIATRQEAPLNQYLPALQALARLVKSADAEPAEKRVDLALALLQAARRDEDKKLAVSALASVPHRRAAAALKPLLTEPALKPEACAAAVSLAESLVRPDKKTAQDLAAAVKAATDQPDLVRRADRVLSR